MFVDEQTICGLAPFSYRAILLTFVEMLRGVVCCVLFMAFIAGAVTEHSETGRTVFEDPVEKHLDVDYESDCGCHCNKSVNKSVACSNCNCIPGNLPTDTLTLRMYLGSLGNLSSSSFAHLPLLRKLALIKCQVKSIDIGTFDNLTDLEDIDLTGNPDIGQLPGEVFTKLPNLTRLVLTHIQRSCEFNENVYLHLKRLQSLSLERNQLINFPRFLDNQTRKTPFSQHLKLLNLNRNNMRKLLESYFYGLYSLEVLTLSSNSIAFVQNCTFRHLKYLKKLVLDFNPLVYISDTSFFSNSLTNLSIAGSAYKFTETSSQNPVRLFQGTPNLTFLNVSHSIGIMSSVIHHFRDVKNLEVLVTEGNRIPDEVVTDLIRNLTRLRHLDLTDNNLNFLEGIPFEDLRNLSVLKVGSNWLITIDSWSLRPRIWKSLKRVDFSLNPLICDCGIVWFRYWLSVTKTLVENRNLILCAAPANVKKHNLSDITHPSDKECFRDALDALYVTSAIVILVNIFGAISAVLHRFRWHIKYWYFLYQVSKIRRKLYLLPPTGYCNNVGLICRREGHGSIFIF